MSEKPLWAPWKVALVTWVTMVVLLIGGGVAIIVATDDGRTEEIRTAKVTQGALTFSTFCAAWAFWRRTRKLAGK